MSRLRKYDLDNGVHYVTSCTYRRKKIFAWKEEFCTIFVDALDGYRRKRNFKLYGYVLMPDHFHLLIQLAEGDHISKLMMNLKGWVARQILDIIREIEGGRYLLYFKVPEDKVRNRRSSRYSAFQEDFYDFLVYDQPKLLEKLRYIHHNPVRWGLVEQPSDYRYSSARNYELDDHSVIRIDRFDA